MIKENNYFLTMSDVTFRKEDRNIYKRDTVTHKSNIN